MRNRVPRLPCHPDNSRRQDLRPAALLAGAAVPHPAVPHRVGHHAVKAVPRLEYLPAVHHRADPAWAGRHLRG